MINATKNVYKQAEETVEWRDILIDHLDVLMVLYADLLCKNANSPHGLLINDDGLFNKTLSEMIVISKAILPKLKGSGGNVKHLVEEYETFEPWLNDMSIPKTREEERRRVHLLYDLIMHSYDALGLCNY